MTDLPGDSDRRLIRWRKESPVDDVPWRVVSLVPSLTESLFDLGLGDRLIAVTDYCVRPAVGVQSLPRVGGPKNPDVDYIAGLEPDLVLMNDEENRREDADHLRSRDVPVWATGPRTVLDVLNLLWDIMEIFDYAVMVPRVRQIEQVYDYTVSAARAMRPVRCFVPIWCDPWMTFNRDTYSHDVLCICGGQNVFAGRERQFPLEADLGQAERLPDDDPRVAGRDRRYPRISLSEVVQAQPDIVLLPDEPYAFGPADVETFQALDIPAAHTGRIYPVDGSLLTWHGTRVAYALRDLPPLLAGESGQYDSAGIDQGNTG